MYALPVITAFYKTSRAAHFQIRISEPVFFNIFARETPERAFTSTMPPDDDAPPMDDAALLAALNQPHVDLSELVVTDVKVHDEEALIRRVNLLEILTEEHEDVHPPPEEVVSSW
jgi:hypothetical protein